MNNQILGELREIEQELAKLSKLKVSLEAKAQKIKEEIKASPDVKTQPKSTENKTKRKSKKQRKKEKQEKIKSKSEIKKQPKKKKTQANTKILPAKKFVKVPKADKKQAKKKKTPAQALKEKAPKADKKQAKKKKTPAQALKEKAIPFGTIPETGIKPSEPMSFIGMVVTGIIDRIEQALDGRSELVEFHTGTGNHVDTAEYNGTYISARSYYHRLDVAARSTVLVKICNEAKKEVELINVNDKSALAAYEEGKLISNILVEKQDEILARLFRWVFDSEQSEDGLSSVDALFPFIEAFGGTKYKQELASDLDKAANEDISGGIEREEYDPKNTFTGYLTGREFVILPDDTIQPINDSNIKFKKGSDGKYLIGGKSYTLKEAIERL